MMAPKRALDPIEAKHSLAMLCQRFEVKTLLEVDPPDDTLAAFLREQVPGLTTVPGELLRPDAVLLHKLEGKTVEELVTRIESAKSAVRPGGMLMGNGFIQRPAELMRAVAECFSLMDVGVAPDMVWFVGVP